MKMRYIAKTIYSGIVIGFFIGLGRAVYYIAESRYVDQGMVRLMLLSLQDNINKWVLFLFSGALLFSVIALAITKLIPTLPLADILEFRVNKESKKRFFIAVICFIVSLYGCWLIEHYLLKSRFRYLSPVFNASASALFLFTIIWWLLVRLPRESKAGIFEKYIARAVLLFIIPLITLLNSVVFTDRNLNTSKSQNIIWIVIDALRADHLGCYGYERDTSPFIDKLANENILFKNAFSQESYTIASVPSFFTSTYPQTHGVLHYLPAIDTLELRFITIAEILRNANYSTAAFVFTPRLRRKFNFDQGFDHYDNNKEGFNFALPSYEAYETAKKIYEKTEQYIKKNPKRPVFLYLHYRDVHSPYLPPPPYNKLFLSIKKGDVDFSISQYDAEIRYTNDYIENTLRMLEKYNINRDNSIVIITADHGEEFFDYHPKDAGGYQHGRTLYMELIHVPLIISLPHGLSRGKKIESYVGLIDIAPTILDALNMNWKECGQFQGRSLMPVIKGEDKDPGFIYSGGNHGRGALIEDGYKYYLYDKHTKDQVVDYQLRPSNNYNYLFGEEVYNINLDPKETKNLIDQERVVMLRLKKKLQALKEKIPVKNANRSVKIDEQTKKEFRSLGYLQ